jgi:hypothetical protein
VRVLGEEPGPGLPNQHAKFCPEYTSSHCWCPPATGPGQPHEPGCSHFKRPYHDWDYDLTEALAMNLHVQAQVQAYNHELAKSYAHAEAAYALAVKAVAAASVAPVAVPAPSIISNECTCVAGLASPDFGAIPHAWDCPLSPTGPSD